MKARELALAILRVGLADIAASLALALAAGAAVMAVSGYDPIASYYAMFVLPLRSLPSILEALYYATPVVLTALTFAVGLRAGLFNIGAEGQTYLGALGAVAAAYLFRGPLALPAAVAFGVGLAAAWASAAAALKIKRGVNEVISTIMLNWMAYWLVIMLASTAFANPQRAEETVHFPAQARLAPLTPTADLSAAFFASVAAAAAAFAALRYTAWGYRLTAVGLNPNAARAYGISPERAFLEAFLAGAVFSGLAGVFQVAANPPGYALTTDLATVYGLGFDGITAAMLGRGDPLGIIAASAFLGVMREGARYMQVAAGTPFEFVTLIQGLIIFFLALRAFARPWTPR